MENRVRLWLRSERAFGLSAVPRSFQENESGGEVSREDFSAQREDEASEAPQHSDPDSITRPQSRADLFAQAAKPNEMAPRGGLTLPTSVEPFAADSLSTEEKKQRLTALDQNEIRGCKKCRLCESRSNTVFGEGDVDAKIVFIGEGPGENEDLQGRPFVGRAGEMLNKWIAGMGLRREDVFIVNIVKCRPPGNREPAPDEVATCTPYLQRQLEIIRPKVIVTLGLPSLKYMMSDPKLAMGRSRGTWREWRGIKLMPTFHPAYILRNYTAETRAAVWSDLKMVLAELGMPVPSKKNA